MPDLGGTKEVLTWQINSPLAARYATWLFGPTGIGKTDVIEQVARENGAEFIYLNATGMEPTDMLGLPALDTVIVKAEEEVDGKMVTKDVEVKVTRFAPPLPFVRAAYARKSILCIDEASRLTRQCRNAVMPLLDRKSIGDLQLPAGCLVVCTANPPDEEDYQVDEIDKAMLRRSIVLPTTFDLDRWRQWGVFNGVTPRVLAAAGRLASGLFRKVKHPYEQILTPFGLKMASDLVKAGLFDSLERDLAMMVLQGAAGREAAGAILEAINDTKLTALLEAAMKGEELGKLDHDISISLVYLFWEKIQKNAAKYTKQIKNLYNVLNADIRILLVQLVYEQMIRYPNDFKDVIEEWSEWCAARIKKQQERKKGLGFAQ
jgi:hypothetical protein